MKTPDGHTTGKCTWYSINVQYECSVCGACLTYDHASGHYIGAHKGAEQNVKCIPVAASSGLSKAEGDEAHG